MDREPLMDPDVRAVKEWLQDHTNRFIIIKKEEDGDTDRVGLEIREVGYRPPAHSVDGYTDGAALIVHGRGTIRSDAGDVPLPDDRYVIPVPGLSVIRESDAECVLKTDRAKYVLSVLPVRPRLV